jgi:hypothetical protein
MGLSRMAYFSDFWNIFDLSRTLLLLFFVTERLAKVEGDY